MNKYRLLNSAISYLLLPFYLVLFTCSSAAFATNYQDKIASKACDCMENIPSDTTNDKAAFKFGICIIEASQKFDKKIKAEYGVSIAHFSSANRNDFGKTIGVRAASKCPVIFESIISKVKNDTPQSNLQELKGVISNVVTNDFITIDLLTNDQVTYQLIWLNKFKNAESLLQPLKSLKSKQVRFLYAEKQFYDPSISDYRTFRVINNFEWL